MKRILIPCDFSDTSENALNYGVELANYFSADIILLHSNQIPVMNPEMGLTAYSMEDINNDSLDALKNLAQKLKLTNAKVGNIEYHSEIGSVEEAVKEAGRKYSADLIVMGISGHGSALSKALIGSAAVSVSKDIEIPVLIVPPGINFGKIGRIAYACNYDKNIASGLAKVKEFNAAFESSLYILHVVEKGHELNTEEIEVDNYIERRLDDSPHRTFIISENKTSEALLAFTKNNAIDLIIIEPKKHSLFHKLFNKSVTEDIAFNSTVPVLAIH